MLDTDTKRRIDNCRDILVGKVPDPKGQVEQITIALIYKFMDDMDKQSMEMGGKAAFFIGEYEKYAWTRLYSPRTSGHELLTLYSEALVQLEKNAALPQLFRDIFKNAYLPYRDPETLRSFLKEINNFTYDHSERLGDAFEYLLSVLGSQGQAGQFRTPRHIIDFIVEVVDPQPRQTVLDPACGTAGFLISAYRHILRQHKSLSSTQKNKLMKNFVGYDISYDMVRLSLVNMYLHRFPEPHIFEYDTLTYEDRWNDTFDVILANPPFMTPKGGIKPHKRFSIPAKRSEVLFVDYIAEHLNPGGRAGVIVPEGIVFNPQTAYKKLRKMLVDDCLWAVVSLPSGVFNPYANVKTSVLLFDRQIVKQTDKILFVKIENDGFDLGAQRRPVEGSQLPAALEYLTQAKSAILGGTVLPDIDFGHAVAKSEILASADLSLSGDRYRDFGHQQNTVWPMVELGEVCDFNSGLWKGKRPPYKEVAIIRNTNFTQDGFIDLSDVAIHPVEVKQLEKRTLAYGDIILEKSGGGPTQPVGRVVFFDIKDGIYSYSNFTSRLRVADNRLLPKFLWLVLKGLYDKGVTENFQKRTSGIRNLDFSAYKAIKIPLSPLEVQEKIVAEIEGYQKVIDGARQVIEHYRPTIRINPDWPIKRIGYVCELATGGTPSTQKKEYYENGSIPWLVSGDIHQGEIYSCDNRITEKGMKNSNAKYLPVNSVLIALNGQGKTRGTVAMLRMKATCNQSIISMMPKDQNTLKSEFLFYILKNMYQYIRNLTGDKQRSGLSMRLIKDIKIPIAPIEVQELLVTEMSTEQAIIEQNKMLIERFESKIQTVLAAIWGAKDGQQ